MITASLNKKNKVNIKIYGLFSIAFLLLVLFLVDKSSIPKLNSKDINYTIVKKGDINHFIDGFGVIKAKQKQVIASNINGVISNVNFRQGSVVKKGDVIFKITSEDINDEYDIVKYKAESERLKLKELSIQLKIESIQREKELQILKYSIELTAVELDSMEQVFDSGIIKALDLKKLKIIHKQKTSVLGLTVSEFESLSEISKEKIEVQNERLKLANIQFGKIKSKINSLTYISKTNGILTKINVIEGSSIKKGEELAIIVDPESYYAEIKLPQKEFSNVEIGQESIISANNSSIKGQITHINPTINEGLFNVEIDIVSHKELSNNQNLSARVKTGETKNAMFLIDNGLLDLDSKSILIVKESNLAKRSDVTFDSRVGEYLTISSGLSIGDKVIISKTSMSNVFILN